MSAALWISSPVAADPVDDLGFDLFAENGEVRVWVDINQLMTASNWEQLTEGADIAFDLSFSLTTPRRLYGESEAAHSEQGLKLSHQLLTDTYYCGSSVDQFEHPRSFVNQDELASFIADSLTFAIAHLDSLDQAKRYTLRIQITRVSVAQLSRYNQGKNETDGESPLQPLFRLFLDLTQFGRQEFRAESRPLTLDELTE
jgi:hypothetical protein